MFITKNYYEDYVVTTITMETETRGQHVLFIEENDCCVGQCVYCKPIHMKSAVVKKDRAARISEPQYLAVRTRS